jgi:hypothetical protein
MPFLLITDPKALAALEAKGASLPDRLSARLSGAAPSAASISGTSSNRALLANPIYASLVSAIEADLAQLAAQDPKLAPGLRTIHRLFDPTALRAETARFELVGLVNRLDRRPFTPRHCGELRLVYRLTYAVPQGRVVTRSRLPMTINLVYYADDDRGGADCQRIAALLATPQETLFGSPLFSAERLKSLEVNLQSVRWPSTIRPDLAGHAEYLLRVFHIGQDDQKKKILVPAPLENTPDVERLQKTPELKKDLLAWLRLPENLARIDEGTAVLPEKFLARRAISFAPRGFGRLGNRLFRQLFKNQDFADLDLENRRYVRSPAALLRRLDGLSCAGCHQSRSVAGFHLIGEDASRGDHNGIRVAASPHLSSELVRRELYIKAIVDGKTPDEARPFPERADSGEGGYGSHCGLADPGFAAWGCRAGFVCTAIDETEEVGACLPVKSEVGDPCEIGAVAPDRDAHRDRIPRTSERPCPESGVCQSNYSGFPGGMCSVSCAAPASSMVCGGIPQLRGFNDCLAHRRPFAECISENVRPSGLRACDEKTPCRDDYICACGEGEQGVCMPPYFLFQMRVDGHPKL